MSVFLSNAFVWGFALFLITVLFGFWLLKYGKPYRTELFNLHKLVALATAILFVYRYFNSGNSASQPFSGTLLYLGIGIFLVLALFGSGVVLSIGKKDPKMAVSVHRIAASLSTLAVLIAFYLYVNQGF